DPRARVQALSDVVRDVQPGTGYVLSVLRPTREHALDRADLARATQFLTGRPFSLPEGAYAALAGVAGQPPVLAWGSTVPFRRTTRLGALAVDVRMESWLAFDTIRRMGFGQVIVARHHTLIVERGISFATFDGQGRPLTTAYAANIFAPQPRYLVAAPP